MNKTYSFFILAALALGLSAKANAAPLDCQLEPGASLCRQVRLLRSYMVTCSGGCNDLLRRQADAFNATADLYYGATPPSVPVAPDLASEATAAAAKICGYQWTNVEQHLLSRIITGANRALQALRDLQAQAGIAVPRFCTVSQR